MRQSAGHVKIYSEVGEGTTVKDLPAAPCRCRGRGGGRGGGGRAGHAVGAETILVVEDDEALRTYTTEILAELGYRVLAAANGAAALEIIERGPKIDLLFTDVVMPGGMNGRQLADEAVRRRPGLKVLFTTGYTRNAIVHHGRLDPGVQMIGKPFTFADLREKIRPARPRIARRAIMGQGRGALSIFLSGEGAGEGGVQTIFFEKEGLEGVRVFP